MFDVAGLGASAVDITYVLPAHPEPEGARSKLAIQSQTISAGGQMATAMAGCAALGLRAAFLGPTGADDHGALVRSELAKRGVDLTHSPVAGTQAYSIILLAENNPERIVLWDGNPSRMNFRFSDLPEILPGRISPLARLLHVDDVYPEAAVAAARAARDAGALVTTDIDQIAVHTTALLEAATHPILAEHVPQALTGISDPDDALRALRQWNAAQPIVVTLGARGAMALAGDRIIRVPGFSVQAVDTTGAGDVFRAGFIAALLDGRPLDEILRFANAAAAVSCTRRGAMVSVPSRADVEALLRQA